MHAMLCNNETRKWLGGTAYHVVLIVLAYGFLYASVNSGTSPRFAYCVLLVRSLSLRNGNTIEFVDSLGTVI